ncbi:hypothetical protein ACVILJ_007812 [Bradyrhizobium diazoefficiens]
MHGETDVLQHGIEIASLDRRVGDTQERVRGHQDEEIEGTGDPGLHREHMRAQRQRKIVAERRDQSAEQRQDRHPQQHRAFMVSPNAGDLVEQRLHRMRILVDVGDGEIRIHMQHHQRHERGADEQQLRQRGGARHAHQRIVAQPRADQRHDGLDQCQPERQHQRVMPGFRDHRTAPCGLPCAVVAAGLTPSEALPP